jgi:hypothetical protein
VINSLIRRKVIAGATISAGIAFAFLILAWRADWFTTTICRQEFHDPIWTHYVWTAEARKTRVARTLRSLFTSSETLMSYECKILLGRQTVTSASFYFEGPQPQRAAIIWPERKHTIFDFGEVGSVSCEWQFGDTSTWKRGR